ncbi:MAG: hypothetical protein KKE86_15785 [Planctomycetes bacterium]|nr:hypothetical protein [Planctomycetota bacterium]MBU4400777.1 hypothetical protein [Planctomycetota bacterium]MCG2683182.1 hypothetical protein [Planctomycetales bacterium]
MRTFDDPSFLTPDERLSEVAAILAGGVLRLYARSALSCDNPGPAHNEGDSPIFVGRKSGQSPDFPNSGPAGLEVSEETVLSVHSG